MTNMTKRLLSLAIAVIMMISLLPVSVFAETPAELPQAEVTKLSATTLAGGDYMIHPSGDNTVERPLEIAVNFKAIDTLEECLAGDYSQWLVDFYLTIDNLAGDAITADNCYLAGNYGTFGWIEIPLDGQTIESGVTYPIVSQYDATLNYKDICKSVKDFTAAIHIDQAILDANPGMTVKLELVMTNPENREEKIQIGPDYIYGVEALKNSVAAMNKDTNEIYSSVNDAMEEAESGDTVLLLGDINAARKMILSCSSVNFSGVNFRMERRIFINSLNFSI